MPIQAPQWTDFLTCPVCLYDFDDVLRLPISLGCGHCLCRGCLESLSGSLCPFDQTTIPAEAQGLPPNSALLQLLNLGCEKYADSVPVTVAPEYHREYRESLKCMEALAIYLRPLSKANHDAMPSSSLSRPLQRKLVTLISCQLGLEDGKVRAVRAARSIGERAVTELILHHQNGQISSNLWSAVRARGCQFLGPAMQEETLNLVLLALNHGASLSRKVLVLFVVQRLVQQFPQASKTSVGHVVQLLYRASCFKVTKREDESSLMELKEEFRQLDALRKEHDMQIVQIAIEAGLRISPEQWSSLLYGDLTHKSHMQSIIDKLQTPESFASSIRELTVALQRSSDPAQLSKLRGKLEQLAAIDQSPDVKSYSWEDVHGSLQATQEVVAGLVDFLMNHSGTMRAQDQQAQSIKYKTSMCRDIVQKGGCPRGTSCTFAHSEEELERYRSRSRRMLTGMSRQNSRVMERNMEANPSRIESPMPAPSDESPIHRGPHEVTRVRSPEPSARMVMHSVTPDPYQEQNSYDLQSPYYIASPGLEPVENSLPQPPLTQSPYPRPPIHPSNQSLYPRPSIHTTDQSLYSTPSVRPTDQPSYPRSSVRLNNQLTHSTLSVHPTNQQLNPRPPFIHRNNQSSYSTSSIQSSDQSLYPRPSVHSNNQSLYPRPSSVQPNNQSLYSTPTVHLPNRKLGPPVLPIRRHVPMDQSYVIRSDPHGHHWTQATVRPRKDFAAGDAEPILHQSPDRLKLQGIKDNTSEDLSLQRLQQQKTKIQGMLENFLSPPRSPYPDPIEYAMSSLSVGDEPDHGYATSPRPSPYDDSPEPSWPPGGQRSADPHMKETDSKYTTSISKVRRLHLQGGSQGGPDATDETPTLGRHTMHEFEQMSKNELEKTLKQEKNAASSHYERSSKIQMEIMRRNNAEMGPEAGSPSRHDNEFVRHPGPASRKANTYHKTTGPIEVNAGSSNIAPVTLMQDCHVSPGIQSTPGVYDYFQTGLMWDPPSPKSWDSLPASKHQMTENEVKNAKNILKAELENVSQKIEKKHNEKSANDSILLLREESALSDVWPTKEHSHGYSHSDGGHCHAPQERGNPLDIGDRAGLPSDLRAPGRRHVWGVPDDRQGMSEFAGYEQSYSPGANSSDGTLDHPSPHTEKW